MTQAVPIVAGRPLLIVDADEVLFHFMAALESFLPSRGCYFVHRSYALYGNIHRAEDDELIDFKSIKSLIDDFFAHHTEAMNPVAGAADTLAELAADHQIVILTNLPAAQTDARRRSLDRHGFPYPMIVNEGGKGPAVRALSDRAAAPTTFIDDISLNHKSVREAAPDTFCIHYIADPRLAELAPQAPASDVRARDWADIRRLIGERAAAARSA